MPGSPIQLLIVIIDLAGGTGAFCRSLASGLKKYFPGEFKTSLLVLRGSALGEEQTFDHVHTLDSQVDRNWRRWYQTPAHIRRLSGAIKRINPDLVLTVNTYSNLLVPLAARRRRIVLSVHSNTTQQLTESRFPRLISSLMRRIYPKRTIVAPTKGVADDLAANFDIHQSIVIPHGIDLEAIRAEADQAAPDIPQFPYIIAVGRLTTAKDYPTLLQAYAAAKSQGLQEQLVIVGGGELRDSLTALARELKIDQSVHFLGYRPNPFPYVKAARIFVLSSIWEGFGLSLLEALALEKPCIATDCPSGPAEILNNGEFGVVVKVGDVAALAQAMLHLAGSSETRDVLSWKASLRASQLSLQAMAYSYRQLFLRELQS